MDDDGRRFFDCKACGKRSKTKPNAMKHIIQVHGVNQFKCGICDKPFARKDAMKRHMGDVHDTKKEFVCGKCNKSFSRTSYGKLHYNECIAENM